MTPLPPTPTGFPSSFLLPLPTALGPAWPRPRVRRLMAEMENVQKRMTLNQQLRNGIMMTPKDLRQSRFDALVKEYRGMEAELGRVMEAFKKMPATKEQFKRPDALLSECCDAYTKEEDGIRCVECGDICSGYMRLHREDWAAEWKQAEEDALKEVEAQKKDAEPPPAPVQPKGLTPGWLIQ